MSKIGKHTDTKVQVFRKIPPRGKGAELLPEQLAKLPGNMVTKEEPDGDRAHALDAPHVVDQIVEDRLKEQAAADKPEEPQDIIKRLSCAKPGERCKLTQWEIDVVRMRVIYSILERELHLARSGKPADLSVRHMWFPEDEVNIYSVREGNPPAEVDRLPHLRGFDLAVDVLLPQQSIIDVLKASNIEWVDFRPLLRKTLDARVTEMP